MTSDRDREFAEFVAVSSVALQRTAFLVCADRDHAADAVQEALYRLYVSWPKFQRASNPMAYARRAVVNAAVDAGRRPWRRGGWSANCPKARPRTAPDGMRSATSCSARCGRYHRAAGPALPCGTTRT